MLKLERLVHDGGRSHVGEILLLLARGEDAGNDDVIGLGKRLREFRAEETRAGEQVRLEDHTDLGLRVAATGRIQQRSDFGRMMRVIIDDRHLADGATDLEAACGTEERGDRRGGTFDVHAQQRGRDNRRGGVACVVDAGNGKRHCDAALLFADQSARNMQREMFGSAFGGFAFRFDAYQRGTVQVAQFGGVPC